jgi:hypothetical protein
LVASSAVAAEAGSAPFQHDSYARIIARADAVVLGRVLEAGIHEVPDPGSSGEVVTLRGFAKIAVERWILGPDTASTLDVRLSPDDRPVAALQGEASASARRVILYLLRSGGEWWLVRDIAAGPDNPAQGIEVLSPDEALQRIPAILQAAAACSLDSLAARADLAAICLLSSFISDPPGMVCRVERVVAGTSTDTVLVVVTPTPVRLHRGRALLLLAARPDSHWEVLDDGAGCYYLGQDRIAHSTASLGTVLNRVVAAHGRRAGGPVR